MIYNALDVAQYIIQREGKQGRIISNLKLQNILYFVQAEFLVSTGIPCFKDPIEAWSFGPVVVSVYNQYKVYGSGHIPARAATGYIFIFQYDQKLIDGIVDTCYPFSASLLGEIIQHQDPWLEAKDSRFISNENLREYFQEKEMS